MDLRLNDIEKEYPHIYGPLNIKAVIDVVEFSAPANGEDKFSIDEIAEKLAD